MANGAKTHRGAAKRFKKTGSGKLAHRSPGLRHCLSNKNRKMKRNRKGNKILSSAQERNITRLIG